jgi:uncharacterized tellurite resistance protein B-like protein
VAALGGRVPARPPIIPVPARSALAGVGAPTPRHLEYAAGLRSSFSDSVKTEARDPLGASALVYAMLLSGDAAARKKQLDELGAAASPAAVQETLRVLPEVEALAAAARLPLVDLVVPGLRHMSAAQFAQFREAIGKLVESDGEIDLFEFMIQKVILRHLEPHFSQARKPVIQYYSLKPLIGDCGVLLSALAYVGARSPDAIRFAFEQGAQTLGAMGQGIPELVADADCELEKADAVLDRLSTAVPQIRKNVLNACAQVVAADGVIEEMEAELLRAIADALDCPLPPLLTEDCALPAASVN